jgi:hypothetical protein
MSVSLGSISYDLTTRKRRTILLSLYRSRGKMTIVRGTGRRARDPELQKAIETHNRLHEALKLLFELLENYSPVWYEKHYHDQAESALKLPLAKRKLKLIQ